MAERKLSVAEAQSAFAALQTLAGSDPLAGGEALVVLLEQHAEGDGARYLEAWLRARDRLGVRRLTDLRGAGGAHAPPTNPVFYEAEISSSARVLAAPASTGRANRSPPCLIGRCQSP